MISATAAEGYTGNPHSGRGQYTRSCPVVELHLRIDRTPSLPPQTNKHTTHPTWYVLLFILSGVLRSSLDAERGVKAVVEIRFAALEDRVSYRIRIRPKSCLRFTRLFGAVWGICWSSFLAHLRRFCFYFVCLFFGWWWWGGGPYMMYSSGAGPFSP